MKLKDTKSKQKLSIQDKEFVRSIRNHTKALNINNVTRTKAYLTFYRHHPEIHWAFLAHMVSRNAGWNMTDLKGSLITKLLNKEECSSFFQFIERGNWLIFHDAYPQLLLYEESKKVGRNLFYLLPHLDVSLFMKVLWEDFWLNHDSSLLTVSQIINEQNFIESRVINNSLYQDTVFHTLKFKLQNLFSFNHILFPFQEKNKIRLIGQTVHQFESLSDRIHLGKRLYAILFHYPDQLKNIEKWAFEHNHTGSRKDFWPHIFNNIKDDHPEYKLKQKLKSCKLLPNATRFYSPNLEFSWKNQEHPLPKKGDWYHDWKVIHFLNDLDENIDQDIEKDYCKTLERLEIAVVTKQNLLK